MKSTISNLKSQITAATVALLIAGATHADPLKVCTTTPDLGALVREVGGDEVEVVTFCKGTEDAHFVEARPSFIKELSRADLYVQSGMELEVGWAPVLLRGCRNDRVQPGGPGYLDASNAITPRDVPAGPINRSMGDVHALGNPHYLLDPVNALKVARLIRDKLSTLRPERSESFTRNCDAFCARLAAALVGEELAHLYDVEKLMILQDAGKLDAFLESQNQSALLGGWFGKLRQYRGAPVVDDHTLWSYFAFRFGLDVIGHMEPKPGISPTTRHLKGLVETMNQRHVRVVLSSVYFDESYASFLVENSDARHVTLAHQVGAIPEASGYVEMIDANVERLAVALEAGGG